MKKLLIFLCLMMAEASVYAQKEYVIVRKSSNGLYLGGKIPDGVDSGYSLSTSDRGYVETIGKVLNLLAEKGFELNFTYDKDFILSRKASGGQATTRIETIKHDDEEVTEVARYNLQGMPVQANEKGIQIIVYSNYTTKTIIVE